ncbi:polynucleotide 5'-hydroxyl-kinase NOL9-like [Punica granatum]|uniref:Polynucleotide 5'-hydroxyl-kinase NOL9-like n=2 Tax=Punica granatum TaxID=22663 RepID=A0A6P8ELI0_PUNGR|nr:polynucleotide 5'-hydroxyl-kinase NOL9-like [Punica granatum]XP_031407209.1 polynucleotide 5'-hydroxyl-kinase NOL9-like [Punica granatum]PKI63168.1 hypothetical protein CRG98_016353 [Punica granatum]
MASPEAKSHAPNICITEEWSEAAESIAFGSAASPPPITLVCGPKNSGKTTFSRHLVNVLLQRYKKVAFLDTDVGQTEFTPPGILSLCIIDKPIPDLTILCMKTPERCFFFGDTSSNRDPRKYLKCISALYNYYREELRKLKGSKNTIIELPLVVNTPGWVKGTGYEVLVKMINYVSPTHVVKIRIPAENKNLPAGAFWLEGGCSHSSLLEIKSVRYDTLNRSILLQKSAALLRDLKVMAYFRQCFPSSSNLTRNKDLARALAALPPYEVPISSVQIRHLYCQVPTTEVFYSLNASIVGLGVSSEESPDLPLCVGLGIVRGIDLFKGLLYVITPVPPRILERVDILLQGFIQIPQGFLQAQGCISPYMATNVLPIC